MDSPLSKKARNVKVHSPALVNGETSQLDFSQLAHKALNIVLQHIMVPHLGWYPETCSHHIQRLWREIEGEIAGSSYQLPRDCGKDELENKKRIVVDELQESLRSISNQSLLDRLVLQKVSE